jgi:uncharacterized LabA/DUF88 family protein
MAFRDTLRVIQPSQRRLKIFVDFWNIVINARKQTSFKVDILWNSLTEHLVAETRGGYGDESSGELAGAYIFGSYSKSNAEEHEFINNTVDKYGALPGLFFEFKERVKKETASKCANCGEPVHRSSELGVDMLLAVEMIKHASMREHDYLALVSSDRDYLPLLAYLKDQGQRVLHVATGEAQRDMRSLTWKQVEIAEAYPGLCRIVHDERFILTSPQKSKRLEQIKPLLESNGLAYKVIDIAKTSDISDKDLDFLLRNQGMFFTKKNGLLGRAYAWQGLRNSLYDFRKAIYDGAVDGNLPHVISEGRMELYFNQLHGQPGWIRNGATSSARIWETLKP